MPGGSELSYLLYHVDCESTPQPRLWGRLSELMKFLATVHEKFPLVAVPSQSGRRQESQLRMRRVYIGACLIFAASKLQVGWVGPVLLMR
jgi:hypothetical protein